MSDGEPLAVRLDQVTAGWIEGKPALRSASLTIAARGVTGVVGPNGSGKSTLVELISGYLRPWQGTVQVGGAAPDSGSVRSRRRICRTAPALFGLMTVRDHLVLSARAPGGDLDVQVRRAERLGLGPWLDENAGTLSSGTAKKLWYLFCTAGDFELVVLDEPFNALDLGAVDVVVDEIVRWAEDRAVVVVAHQPPAGLPVEAVVDLETAGHRG
ncbi:ATP-binding cassette domain-containing protein [Cellulomonas triticagri]|uniref:ATP-binding cassette domain-containing protein n=1 Tax=Cellulomonas triticagri TaxID=2483352 RepID=A0A3M2JT01_9CELL|nr:ATP-binding cassette domain-containing protein [Cellulomonas triticagri]RMI13875.1 ATP-binding cassette domain-containing protein [Cellulomonas triticagri]